MELSHPEETKIEKRGYSMGAQPKTRIENFFINQGSLKEEPQRINDVPALLLTKVEKDRDEVNSFLEFFSRPISRAPKKSYLNLKEIGTDYSKAMETAPLILKHEEQYLIEIQPLLIRMFYEGKTKFDNLSQTKLLEDTPNRVDKLYTCDYMKSSECFRFHAFKPKQNAPSEELKKIYTCLNMQSPLNDKQRMTFISENDWNHIKYEGDWLMPKYHEVVERFDSYFLEIKRRPNKNQSKTEPDPEDSILAFIEAGNFSFSNADLPFASLDKPTDTAYDVEIDDWVDQNITEEYLKHQQINFKFTHASVELGLKSFAANLCARIAKACQHIFYSALHPDLSSFKKFTAIGEATGVPNRSIPDIAVSLLHHNTNRYKAVLLLEEKSNMRKVEESTSQVARYCQGLIKQLEYKQINCLLYSQSSAEIIFVTFYKPTPEKQSFNQLVKYTKVFRLMDIETHSFLLDKLKTFFRIILKRTYYQLLAENMIKERMTIES